MREFDEAALDCAICLSATTLITVKYPIPLTNVGISHKSALNLVITLHCSNMPIMKVPNDSQLSRPKQVDFERRYATTAAAISTR